MTMPTPADRAARPSLLTTALAAPATTMACGAILVVFLGIWSLGSSPSWEQVRAWGYLPVEAIWSGSFWALATSAFVHVAVWHLGFNLYWMWELGRRVERWTGTLGWIAFALGAALVGSSAEVLAASDTGIGASGIVYAFVGLLWRGAPGAAFAGALPRKTVHLFLVWLAGCYLATRLGWANVANAAHVAGLAYGILVAEVRIRREHPRLALAGLSLMALMVLPGTYLVPWSPRWLEHFGTGSYARGDYKHAAATFELGLAFGGADSAYALFHLAVAYDKLGDRARSHAALATLRRLNPGVADTVDAYLAVKASLPDSGGH